MKKFALAVAVVAALASQSSAFAAEYVGKNPLQVHAHPGYPCVSFQLEGVSSVDGTGGPWMSLRKEHPHFSELFAILLTGKAARLPITVQTSGSACGNPSVDIIFLQ